MKLLSAVSTVVLLLLAVGATVSADRGPFKCIHDSTAIQALHRTGMDTVMPQPGGAGRKKMDQMQHRKELEGAPLPNDDILVDEVRARGMQVQTVAGLRVVVSSQDIVDTSQYCTTVGQVVPTFTGTTAVCESYDIMTTAKKGFLLDNIIPAALAVIAQQLSVTQLTSNMIVPAGACSYFTVPTSHTTTGVSDADFVLYVASGPSSEGNLAWAATCTRDIDNRPIVGRANFNPRYINWTTTESGVSSTVNDEQIATAVHELLHALGFSSTNFVSTATATLRGKTVTYVNSPEVLKVSKEFFGCTTCQGGEIEDEGGSGSAGSHWDRRVLKDEMMAAAGGDMLSVMTLAHMKDTGWYTVDYTTAENLEWGQNAGCGFLESKCNTVEGGKDEYFCFDNSEEMCTYKKESIGYCPIFTYTSDLETKYQWFTDPKKGGEEFYDYCPVPKGYSNRLCSDTSITLTDSLSSFGHYFGSGGKCFQTTGLLKDGLSAPGATTLRCLQSRCINDGSQVQFQVDSSGWISCPSDGTAGTASPPSGWQGTITCPPATDICSAANTFTSGPPTPAPPVPPATPIPASVTPAPTIDGFSVIEGTLHISGASETWSLYLTADGSGSVNSEQALKNALQSDIGRRLTIDPVHIQVSNLRLGSLKCDYNIFSVDSHTRADVQNVWTAEENGSLWLSDTSGIFRSSGGNNETIYLIGGTAVSSEETDNLCGNGYTNAECETIFYAAGALLVVIVLVLCIVCCCCCREPSPEAKAEAARQNRAGQYHVQQQQQYGATNNQQQSGGRGSSGRSGRRRQDPY